ncbi:hypothetical protein CR513_46598, partial [Mucuna pruriens]
MKDKMKSMQNNDIWDHDELPKGVKHISCKWLFKTKKDSKGNIKRYKACLKEDIHYKETFYSVSSKDSFRTIMVIVTHFDLELHHMDVKTVFLNGDIVETIYMVQSKNFVSNESKSMVCKLKKFIYGLKQASVNDITNFIKLLLLGYFWVPNYVDKSSILPSPLGLSYKRRRGQIEETHRNTEIE